MRQSFSIAGGMCPRCEGLGTASDIDLSQLYDDSKSIAEGAITIPGYNVDSFWTVQIFIESGFVDPNKPIRDYTKKELNDFLYKDPTEVKVKGVNLTYEGLIPKVQKSFLSKDPDALQPHIRAFVDRAFTFTACAEGSQSPAHEDKQSRPDLPSVRGDQTLLAIGDQPEPEVLERNEAALEVPQRQPARRLTSVGRVPPKQAIGGLGSTACRRLLYRERLERSGSANSRQLQATAGCPASAVGIQCGVP